MAEEKVQYSFTGDVSSLKKATEQAISLLDKYGESMASAVQADSFSASKRSAASFNASIKRMMKDVTSLQNKLKNVGDVRLPTGSQPAQALASTLGVLQDQLQKLNSTDKITTKSLTEMKSALEAVRASVRGATPQVDKLVASEQRFQNILGTVQAKANQFNSKMNDAKTKLAGTFDPITQRLQSFGARFRTVFDSITSKLQGFKDKAAIAFSRVVQLATAVASAFRRVKREADEDSAAADKNARAQARLVAIWQRLQSAGRSVASAFTSMGQKAKQVTTALSKLGRGFKSVVSSIGSFVGKIKEAIIRLTKFGQSTKQASTLTNSLKTAFAGLTAIKIGDWLSKAATQSIRYVENLNLFTVAMGSAADSATEFVDKMARTLGLDPSNIMRHAGYFYQLADAIKMPSESAKILSLSLTKAANDIASLFNVNIEKVTEDLAAGMQGMSRAVRKYGIDIRNVTLQNIALRYGLQEQVGSMSEANRQALRYIAIIEQTAKATDQLTTDTDGATQSIGDFARNIETPANQLRIFKEQISQLGRAIGDTFIKPLATAIAYVNGFVMAVRVAIQFLTSLFGISSEGLGGATDGFKDEADAIDAVGEAAGGAADKVKKLLAPFDELNILAEDTAEAGGVAGMDEVLDPALAQAIADMELKLDEIRMKAHDVQDALLGFFGLEWDAESNIRFNKDMFKDSLLEAFPEFEATINEAFENWNLESIGQIVGVLISGSLSKFADWISWDNLSGAISGFIDKFRRSLNAFLNTVRGDDIGRAIGEAFNTGMQSAYAFIEGIDWARIGVVIGDAINTAVMAVDWSTLGAYLVLKFNILIDMLFNAVRTVDWQALASSISTGLNSMVSSFKLEQLAQGLGGTIQGVFNIIKTALENFDWAGAGARLGKSIQLLWRSIDWTAAGKALGAGISGILVSLQKAVASIDWSSIGTDIANFIAAIDWALASEQFVTAASNIINGLIAGLIEVIPAIATAAGDIVQGLVDGIVLALPTLIPAAIDIVMTIITSLLQQLPMLITAALELVVALAIGIIQALPEITTSSYTVINEIITTLINAIPEIIDAGIQLLTALVAELPLIIETIIMGVGDILQNILESFFNAIPSIIQAGIDLFVALIQELPTIITTILTAIPQIIGSLVGAITDSLPEMILAGVQLFVALIENLPTIIVEIVKAVPQIVAGIVDAFGSLIGEIINIGVDLLKGIWQGISDTADWLWDKVSGFFSGIVDGIKGFFGIKSPSTLMAEIGSNVVEGFSEGIEDSDSPTVALDQIFVAMENATADQKAKFDAWGREVASGMLTHFKKLYTDMLLKWDEFESQWNAKIDMLKSKMDAWSRSLTKTIRTMFTDMWDAILWDTTVFQNNLQTKLDQMVAAARAAAAAIASALSSAQADAAKVSSLASSTAAAASNSKVSSTGVSIAKMATGGVVTGPTYALIGEGQYDEAVIPLGNSPQMKELVDTLANAVRDASTQTDQKVEVHVVIGGKEWDTFTYKSAKRGEVRVGAKPIKAGGY